MLDRVDLVTELRLRARGRGGLLERGCKSEF
jgi:hypothetical protein